MKKIFFIGFTLLQCISFNAQANIYDDIAAHHKKTHSNDFYTYIALNDIENNNDMEESCLVITGDDLKNHKDQIEDYIQHNPEALLLLDVQENDGFVTQNILAMKKEDLPSNCTKLSISNINEDIFSVADKFFFNCRALVQFSLNIPLLKKIEAEFLGYCVNMTQFTLCAPLLEKIEDSFLQDNSNLIQFSLDAPYLTKIGFNFLFYCGALEQLLLNLPYLREIEFRFLSDCHALERVILTSYNQILKDELIIALDQLGKFTLKQLIEDTYIQTTAYKSARK